MASPSCSHWWHAPIYITISIVLAIVAISTPSSHSPQPPLLSPSTLLSPNASLSLRKYGYNFVATLLQISPELLLPPSESTIFAIHDAAFSNISLPPWLMRDLLLYHTSPSKLSLQDLLGFSQCGSLSTLLTGKNLTVTNVSSEERLVEINGVLVSHPDIFTQGMYSIHGVNATFTAIEPLEEKQDWDYIGTMVCEANSSVLNVTESRNAIPWNRILRLLSSSGYVSFAIGLQSVLDMILQDYADLSSVTIFAPSEFIYIASPSPMLERIVRFHVLPERFEYKELLALPVKAYLRTLVDDSVLQVTGDYNVSKILGINGVEVTAPGVFSSKEFVIHGISGPFIISAMS